MRKATAIRFENLPLLATGAVAVLLYAIASFSYHGFFSTRVLTTLLADNASVGITAVGMTLVIFSGGIDLSVGSVVGLTSILVATLLQQGLSPVLAWVTALGVGTLLGLGMGFLVAFFKQPPFLITLAGMFLARGIGFWISTESVGISAPQYDVLSQWNLPIGPWIDLPLASVVFLCVAIGGYLLSQYTRFGRNLLAVGGAESSALLMGLPVQKTKILAYALNGACAALAGIISTLYTGSGNPSMGLGLELDAITVVVIGGTLLAGGRGHVAGTVLGLLIFGTIQTAILFDGRLSPAWTKIVVGLLLLAFILLQRELLRAAARRKNRAVTQ